MRTLTLNGGQKPPSFLPLLCLLVMPMVKFIKQCYPRTVVPRITKIVQVGKMQYICVRDIAKSSVVDEVLLIRTTTEISNFCGKLLSVNVSCYISNGISGFRIRKTHWLRLDNSTVDGSWILFLSKGLSGFVRTFIYTLGRIASSSTQVMIAITTATTLTR